MPHDVFISYSQKDKTVADAVCHFLEARGIRTWIAPRDVIPGKDYAECIVDALSGSHVMVLVFSSNANDSPHVLRELSIAVPRRVVIVPFKIEPAAMSKSMEYFVGPHHWLDAMTPPLERHIETLADSLVVILSQPLAKAQAAAQSICPYQPGTALAEAYWLAHKWADAGYQYYMVEGISGELRAMLRNLPPQIEFQDSHMLNLFLVASLHFGGNWFLWIERSADRHEAAAQVLKVVGTSYTRPHLRALAGLEAFEPEEIRRALEGMNPGLDADSLALVETVAMPRRAEEYLEEIAKGEDPDLGKKAGEVLREVRRYRGKGRR